MSKRETSPNRVQLEQVGRRLRPLLDRLVFVGGQVAELLVSESGATRVRPTNDVDVVVAVTTRTAYQAVTEVLREQGFREDTRTDAPVCRWRADGDMTLDVMPMAGEVLGFTNAWYHTVVNTAVTYALEPGLSIRIAAAPAFLATKWAAFDDRGGGDHFGSHDIEDIITVVAGRPELVAEIRLAPGDLITFLAARTSEFLAHPDAGDAIEGALPDARFDATLINRVRERLKDIAALRGHEPG